MKSQHHQTLTESIISRYYVINPNYLDIEDILKKYVNDYIEKIVLYLNICNCKIFFNDITYNFKLNKMYNIHRYYSLKAHLITKIDIFMRRRQNFSHISEISFGFITKFNNMAYKFCLKQPKPMLDWKLIEKLARNPGLTSEIDRTIYHPLTHAYAPIQDELS